MKIIMSNDILALDPATKMGWAVSPEMSGTWDFTTKRDESGGMKLLRLKGKLNEVLKAGGLRLIVYEAARNAMPKMQGALVSQAKLQGVIELFAMENDIDYKGYSPAEIKKFATGKGNAKKPDMIAAAKARFPTVDILDDNHADALLLWALAKQEYVFT